MQRRAFLAATSAVAAAATVMRPAAAQPWPARPIRIVVPFGLGGSADVAARFLAEPPSAALGVPVIVENRPGGGAVIGTEAVAKATPDGHTLLTVRGFHLD
jgi:tripartite-type tricarboxylate transporter receptor subunit TctC